MRELDDNEDVPADAKVVIIEEELGKPIKRTAFFDTDPGIAEMDSPDDIAERGRLRFEKLGTRMTMLENLQVTTAAGNVYDADEQSQSRMERALVTMEVNDKIDWIMADNQVVKIKRDELAEALQLAVNATTAVFLSFRS